MHSSIQNLPGSLKNRPEVKKTTERAHVKVYKNDESYNMFKHPNVVKSPKGYGNKESNSHLDENKRVNIFAKPLNQSEAKAVYLKKSSEEYFGHINAQKKRKNKQWEKQHFPEQF